MTEETEGQKQGRPTTFDRDLANGILERIAAGESLRSICSGENMPAESTVRLWATDDRDGFSAQYTRAREAQMDALAEDILAIADGDDEDVQRAKLRVDTRKWLMSKIAPKRFGDKLAIGGDRAMDPIRTVDLSRFNVDQLRALESALVPFALASGDGAGEGEGGDKEAGSRD
jgi:hypothetical protein